MSSAVASDSRSLVLIGDYLSAEVSKASNGGIKDALQELNAAAQKK